MVNDQNNLDKICPKCSALLPKYVNFCTECGSTIERDSSNTPPIIKPIKKVDKDPLEFFKRSSKDFMNDFEESRKEVLNEIDSLIKKFDSSQNIICPKCRAKLPKNVNFCTECGSPIEHRKPVPKPKQKKPHSKEKPNYNEVAHLEYLEKLADLRDKGIISNEEFEKKKKDILKI